mgnify:FL=1
MSGDLKEIERQLIIIEMLSQEKRGLTACDIQKQFLVEGINVSTRMIKRDMDTLSEAHLPVYEEKEGQKVRYAINKYTLENVAFTANEVLGLYFLRELIKPVKNVQLADYAYALVDRIIQFIRPIKRSYIDQIKDVLKVDSGYIVPDVKTDTNLLRSLEEAAKNRVSIKLKYYSYSSDKVSKRLVDPYLVYFRDGSYYLVGYCHTDKAIREFKLSRIYDFKKTKQSFKYIEDFSFEEYRRHSFDRLRGDGCYNVKVRFTGEAARMVNEYDRDRADKIETLGDGDILFVKEVSTLDEIKRWILGFGRSARVLEPAELRSDIKDEAKCLDKLYSGE